MVISIVKVLKAVSIKDLTILLTTVITKNQGKKRDIINPIHTKDINTEL